MMDVKNTKGNFKVILVMGLLTAIGPLSIDMYLPAFPAIAKSLHTSVSQVTLSLSSYFLGISAGQLLYGPLLERFGRKKPLYAGLCLFLVSSIGCSLAGSVHILIALRLCQAVGGCVGMIAARAMVRDMFEVKDNARVFSMLMLVVSVSPIIAPTLGGYITSAFGWRYVFAALIVVVLLILAGVYFILPESKKPDPTFSLKPVPIIRNFTMILKHPHFITFALTGAISYAGMYAYLGGSASVFMEIYKVNSTQFGWIFAIIAGGLIGASQANNIALKYYRSEQIVKAASFCQGIVGLTLVLATVIGFSSLVLTVLLVFLFLACQGFIFPNATAIALAPLGKSAGTASSLIGTIQMTIGAGASALVGLLHDNTALPMAGVMTCCAVTAFTVFILGHKFLIPPVAPSLLKEQDIETAGSL